MGTKPKHEPSLLQNTRNKSKMGGIYSASQTETRRSVKLHRRCSMERRRLVAIPLPEKVGVPNVTRVEDRRRLARSGHIGSYPLITLGAVSLSALLCVMGCARRCRQR